jgi:hypothetical protein
MNLKQFMLRATITFFSILVASCNNADTAGMNETEFRAIATELHLCTLLAEASANDTGDRMFASYNMDAAEYFRLMNVTVYGRYCKNRKFVEDYSCSGSKKVLERKGLKMELKNGLTCSIDYKTVKELDEAIAALEGCITEADSYKTKYIVPASKAEFDSLKGIFRDDIDMWRGAYAKRCSLITN